MYTYKLGGMLITDELYHDDLEAMTFGRKDQNELMHYGIKGQSWGKRRFQNEDGSLTMAGRNRYDVGDPLQGSTNRAMAANRTYATGSGIGGFGGASGGGGSLMRKSAPTIQWSTTGKPPFSSEGPGQFAGRTVTNKVKAKVNDTVNSGRKAADSLFGSIGNAIKPVTDAVGKATEFVTGANANRRVEDAQKAYDDASENMLVDNRSNVIGTKGANAEYDAENNEEWARYHNSIANSYDRSAQNRGLFDRAGREADEFNRDQHRKEAQDYAKKANDLRVQAQKEYADDYRKLEEADRNLRAAEKARDENTLSGVVGNAAKDAGNWLGNAFNDAKNWVGDRAQDVGKAATNAYNDVSKAAGDAVNWVGDRAQDVGRVATNAYTDASKAVGNAANWVGDQARNVGNEVQSLANTPEARDVGNAVNKAGDWLGNAFNGAKNWVGVRANDVGNAAKDVGDWASNAASDVRDWGAGTLDKGRQAFENLFGRSEPSNNDSTQRLSDDIYRSNIQKAESSLSSASTASERENILRDLVNNYREGRASGIADVKSDTKASYFLDRADNNFKQIDSLSRMLERTDPDSDYGRDLKKQLDECRIDNDLLIGQFYNNTNAAGRWGPDGINLANKPDNVDQANWDEYVRKNYPWAFTQNLQNNPQQRIEEQRIPEQMIYEQTIPEQLIKEELIREKRR